MVQVCIVADVRDVEDIEVSRVRGIGHVADTNPLDRNVVRIRRADAPLRFGAQMACTYEGRTQSHRHRSRHVKKT